MPRYVALLRGVSPMNARMPDLKRAFENAGFTDVRTVLSSGNVIFDATSRSEAALTRRAEAAMSEELGHTFYTIVRAQRVLREILDSDPFAAFQLPADAKRIVTFLREPHGEALALPLEYDGARILAMRDREAFSVYVPNPRGPAFMTLLERTFGKTITTRTWETVRKCSRC